jgi:HD-GYP domain-containing protein (c-di-GMP phosphodiesterase class II)
MTQHPRKIASFIAVLWLVAAAVFLRSLPMAASAGWADFVIFLCLASLSESWYVGTSQESGMSLSFTVHFAAAVLFGPAFAMMVAVFGLLFTDGLIRRPPLIRTFFNTAQMGISVGLCGLLYQALRVSGSIGLIKDLPALALAALAYLVVNDSLVAGVLSMQGRSFFQEWKLSFKDILLPYVSMAPLGALAAYTYQATPWTLLYFPPLILVIYNGFKLFVSLQRETDHALVALADSIDRRDQYTYEHSVRVAGYVETITQAMDLPLREADMIAAAARVHDLGKIGTDNRVLLKPSSLTPDELTLIKRHAAEGGDLAGKFSMFRQGQRFIRHHHERWDGKGYPDGLAGPQIPLGSRIIMVADCYDAMTSDRPYRKALPTEIAMIELERGAGTQFDPRIIEAFVDALRVEQAATVAAPVTAPEPARPQAIAKGSCSYS